MPDTQHVYSYGLATSRRFGPLRSTLRMASDLGYLAVEGYPELLSNAVTLDQLEAAFGATGLSMPTTQLSLTQLRAAPRRSAALVRRLGVKAVFVGLSEADQQPSDDDDWFLLASRLRRFAEPLRLAGITVGWHHKIRDLQAVNSERSGLAIMLDTDPDLQWQIDLGWMTRAQQSIDEWVNNYGNRIAAAHVRDVSKPGDNMSEDGWADLGKGVVDLIGCVDALRRNGVTRFVLAHDNPSDDERFAARAIATMRRIDQMLVPALDFDPSNYPKPAFKQACMWMTP